MPDLPTITIVFLVHDRCALLRTTLHAMTAVSDYPADRVDVVVVDNASTDGSAAMVRAEFPSVRLVERATNGGVSAWNDGFALARGDYVLALDDDCHLPADGLRRAVRAAEEARADLVSFAVCSGEDPAFRFDRVYETGLLTFWGCAVLMRREVLTALGGYDPEIFVYANELEFMVRFFDRGFTHLHLPEVVAVHLRPPDPPVPDFSRPAYRVDTRNVAYVAGRHLRARHAAGALTAMVATRLRDALRYEPAALRALPDCATGFVHGLRHRTPVRNPAVSRLYRHNLRNYAGPWRFARAPRDVFARPLARIAGRDPGAPRGRRADWFAQRAHLYPDSAAMLRL